MNFKEKTQQMGMNFDGIDDTFFLIGLLSAFDNQYQAKADSFFGEVSWKQFFAMACIERFAEAPTLKELATVMGSSHQNVKQILNKLEKVGFVEMKPDEKDKRKLRIFIKPKYRKYGQEHAKGSTEAMDRLFQGVSKKDLQTTIETIMKMDENLSKYTSVYE